MKTLKTVRIGDKLVGEGQPCYFIAEIGINHNGSLEQAKKLMSLAAATNCDCVKFQKRTVDVVFSQEELERPRESPFGMTNGDLKKGLELGEEEYDAINSFSREISVPWIASCWDEASVDFVEKYNPPAYKIASACLTDENLLKHTREARKPIILSTGMSTIEEVDRAVDTLGTGNLILLHTCSTYPSAYEDINLRIINTLQARYGVPVGYSGHESGLSPSLGAIALGACMIERHITLDRAMWGSDQAASLGPTGLMRLVRDIRLLEAAMGEDAKRLHPNEVPIMKKLRRKHY